MHVLQTLAIHISTLSLVISQSYQVLQTLAAHIRRYLQLARRFSSAPDNGHAHSASLTRAPSIGHAHSVIARITARVKGIRRTLSVIITCFRHQMHTICHYLQLARRQASVSDIGLTKWIFFFVSTYKMRDYWESELENLSFLNKTPYQLIEKFAIFYCLLYNV